MLGERKWQVGELIGGTKCIMVYVQTTLIQCGPCSKGGTLETAEAGHFVRESGEASGWLTLELSRS